MKRSKSKALTGRAIDAMTPARKRKLIQEIERVAPRQRRSESKAATPAEQARLDRVSAKLGRPRLRRGTRVVSVTVEIDLLERADEFAAAVGVKRSELFRRGLESVLP